MSFDDKRFDDQLRQLLRREAAPPDFARNILARAAAIKTVTPVWRRPATLALAAGLLLATLVPPSISEYQRRQEVRAEEARDQLFTALSITRTQLLRVSAKVKRNTRRPL